MRRPATARALLASAVAWRRATVQVGLMRKNCGSGSWSASAANDSSVEIAHRRAACAGAPVPEQDWYSCQPVPAKAPAAHKLLGPPLRWGRYLPPSSGGARLGWEQERKNNA
nr:hypothetical protein [Tanacetum cinerariifolium]